MGLWSEFKEGVDTGFVGLPSLRGLARSFSGEAGAEAALAAGETQANEARASRELFTPIVKAGIAQIPELARGATAEGFGQNIGDILGGGALDPLIAERQRASQAALSGAGIRRSGAAATEAANIPADLAMQIEGELNRRRQSIAGQGQTGAGEQSNLSTMMSQALAGGQLGAAQAQAQGGQNAAGLIGGLLSAFSDMSLKDDVTILGEYGGIEVIDWEWNEKAFEKYGLEGRSTGFNANKLQKTHPDYVIKTNDGTLTVDYPNLLKELKNGSSNYSAH